MFSLIKFDNNELQVVPTKRIKIGKNTNTCTVNWKGSKYRAVLLKTHDSQNILEKRIGKDNVKENYKALGYDKIMTKKRIRNLRKVELKDTLDVKKAQNSSDVRIISNVVVSETHTNSKKLNITNILPADCEPYDSPVEVETEFEISARRDNLPPVDSEMDTETYASYVALSPVEVESEFEISARRVDLPPIDPEIEAGKCVGHIELSPVDPETEATVCNGTQYSVDKNISTTLTNASDSTYVPDQTTISSNDISQTSQNSEVLNNCQPVDVRKITVPQSKKSDKRALKKYFCPFCYKLQSKFARHLELIHKSETEVQKFIKLPRGNSERKKIIEIIRKKGNYIHNTQPEYNTGILITCRQQVDNKNSAEDYVCCKSCKGFFSKRTLRLHYRTCCKKGYTKGAKQMMVMGRKLAGYIHPRANITLRRKVFPVLRDDLITRLIKYDQLIIIFGNKLCEKYTLDHQHDMIRGNLRLLGRFLTAVKEKNENINDLSSVFHPKFFDTVLGGIKTCARYNPDKMMFEAPSVATTIGTLLKKCLKMHMSECIKAQNETAKKAAEDFMILFEEDIPSTINRKVLEDQLKKKRDKIIRLPTKSDITCLYTFLKAKMSEAHDDLEKGFNLESYNTLAECTLVLLQTFNRRRAGEIERLLISDYNNQESIDKNANPDLYNNLSLESRNHAKKFIRITIRGKLGRIVPVLLDTFIVKCIDMIIAFRRKAGIHSENEYVFAVPARDGHKKKYLRACPLMRRFSEECGAKMPCTLRGTTLRKHVATHTAMLGMEERDVNDLANFMGHHKDIHKNVYRVPVPLRDLANVSRILENAMGNDDEDYDDKYDDKSSNKSSNTEISNQPASVISATPTENECDDEPVKTPLNYRRRFISDNSLSNESKQSDKHGQGNNYSEDKSLKKPRERCQRFISNDSLSDSWKPKNSEEFGREIDIELGSDSPKDESKHRRSTSPFGKTKRVRWNSEEKAAITDCFGDPTKCSMLPSLNQCLEATRTYKALKRRTPQQIKTWIDNQRKAKIRLQAYKSKSRKS